MVGCALTIETRSNHVCNDGLRNQDCTDATECATDHKHGKDAETGRKRRGVLSRGRAVFAVGVGCGCVHCVLSPDVLFRSRRGNLSKSAPLDVCVKRFCAIVGIGQKDLRKFGLIRGH